MLSAPEIPKLSPNIAPFAAPDPDLLQLLGKGSFGSVYCAKKKQDQSLHVIKKIAVQNQTAKVTSRDFACFRESFRQCVHWHKHHREISFAVASFFRNEEQLSRNVLFSSGFDILESSVSFREQMQLICFFSQLLFSMW